MAVDSCGPSVTPDQTALTATIDNSQATNTMNLLAGHVSTARYALLSNCECRRRSAYTDIATCHGQPTCGFLKQGR